MIVVQTGNMLDVVVEDERLGLRPRIHGANVLWLSDPEGLRDVLTAEINRLKSAHEGESNE